MVNRGMSKMSTSSLIEYFKSLLYNHGLQNTEVKIQPYDSNFTLYDLYVEAQHDNVIKYKEKKPAFLFLLAGECQVRIGMTTLDLVAGNGVLLESKTSYEVLHSTDDAYLLKFNFKNSFTWKRMSQKVETTTQQERDLVDIFHNILLKSGFFCFKNTIVMWPTKIIRQMVTEYMNGGIFTTNMSRDFIHLIVLDSLRNQLFVKPVEGKVAFKLSTLDGYIDAHYDDITLEETAEFFGFNKNYFSSLVREKTGKSFLEWVDDRRMVEARVLLAQPDISLKEIITKVGYSSKSFFYKKFNNYYGMTPAMMRKRVFRQAKINLN